MHRQNHGFHLLELSVALGLIALLAIISVPVLTKASDRARAEVCFSNLQSLGQKLESDQRRDGKLPALQDRSGVDKPLPTLAEYVGPERARILRCPSDNGGLEKNETERAPSYRWFEAWNQMSGSGYNAVAELPLLMERENFHNTQSNGRAALLLFRQSPTQTRLAPDWIDGETYRRIGLGNQATTR